MPEGPSIVILKEAVTPLFKGKKILEATGNAKIDMSLLKGKTVTDFKSWGKHFLICTKNTTVRIHFLLFGSYTINDRKDKSLRLHLKFSNGEVNFYTCAIKLLEDTPDNTYDWTADVMNDDWDAKQAKSKLKNVPDMLACDALLNQDIFAGVGNIIKNEVLFRIKVHPKSKIGALPTKALNALIKEARNYSFDFLRWKKEYTLRQHWLAHNKKICPRCNIPFHVEYLGKTKRRSFFCNNCQELYK